MNDIELLKKILINIVGVPERCIEEIHKEDDGTIECRYTCGSKPQGCLGGEYTAYEIAYKVLKWIEDDIKGEIENEEQY